MQSLLIVAALLATPEAIAAPPDEVAGLLAREVQTGTLLFTEGDCLAVRAVTRSQYTHVASVVVEEDEIVVYDSMKGIGARRQTLDDYFASHSPDVLHVVHPRKAFTDAQQKRYAAALEAELGREYDVAHHLTGQSADGLHCSEYATEALIAANVIRARRPSKVSPATLLEGVQRTETYGAPITIQMRLAPMPEPRARNWCHGLWLDTKECTASCWSKLSGWCLCK